MKRRMRIAFLSCLAVVLPITTCGCRMTSTESTGPRVEIPRVKNGEASPDINSVNSAVVSIPTDGELYFGKERVQLNDLTQRVSALLSTRRPYEQIVYFRCGKLVKYGAVVEVMAKVREAGIHYIGFVTENENGGPAAAMFEAAILQKLTEAEMKSPLSPPPPREEIATLPPQDLEFKETPPPPPPAPKKVQMVEKGKGSQRPISPPGTKSPREEPPPVVSVYGPNPDEPMFRLVVEMRKEGAGPEQTISLNREALPLAELETKLSQIFDARTSNHYSVYLRAPKEKLYQDVIYAMDRIKGARAGQIVIHIDYLDGDGPNLLRPRTETIPNGVEGGIPGVIPGVIETPPPPPEASKPETPKTVRMSGSVLLGQTIRRVEPTYPPIAKAAHVSGPVVVEVIIDEEGNVISAQVLSGHPLLQDAAVQAARGWKFTPMKLNGAPVRVIGAITFNFTP